MPSHPRQIRVLIADDNRVVRRGLRLMLDSVSDIRVIGEVSNGADAVTATLNERVDVVLMDLQMPGVSGAEATRAILSATEPGAVAVLVMTSFAIETYVAEALDAGAVGYLLKGHDSDQLLDAIYAASRGETIVSTRVIAPMLREFVRRGPRPAAASEALERLSAAERRVVAALSSGHTSNLDIASHLNVSVHTVRAQLQAALKKTGLNDRTQLALWGVHNNLDSHSA